VLRLVDSHLDLAYNAVEMGLDQTLPLEALRARRTRPYTPSVSLPELRSAGVTLALATVFVSPERYPDPAQAHRAARHQVELYHRWQEAGLLRLIGGREELADHLRRWEEDRLPGVVLLMEGAEPVRRPEEVELWRNLGVRAVAPAWQDTRYAGGTGGTAGLSELGRELLSAMKEAGLALDLSHLSEAAFFEALEAFEGPVMASHSNYRPLAGGPKNRHLTDEQLRSLKDRGAVVGIVLYNRFLDPEWERGDPATPLSRVREHLEAVARVLGWEAVGIGSDMDGGFGAESLPRGIASHRDWKRLEALLGDRAPGVLGENWLTWFRENLPG